MFLLKGCEKIDENVCPECGDRKRITNTAMGHVTCANCGMVLRGKLFVNAQRYRDCYDKQGNKHVQACVADNYAVGACYNGDTFGRVSSKVVHSAPYSRLTYFNELISQWQMQEPPIPAEDWNLIEQEYNWQTSKERPDRWFDRNHVLTKTEIRRLLRSIDEAGVGRRVPRFVKRYYVSNFFFIHKSYLSSCGMHGGVCMHVLASS